MARHRLQIREVLNNGDTCGKQQAVCRAIVARRGVDVQRIDTHQSNAGIDQRAHRGLVEKRVIGTEVFGRSPVLVPSCVYQQCCAAQVGQHLLGHMHCAVQRGAHHDGAQIGAALERKPGEIMSIGVTVKGGVEVGACVGAHLDGPDVELDTVGVSAAALLA